MPTDKAPGGAHTPTVGNLYNITRMCSVGIQCIPRLMWSVLYTQADGLHKTKDVVAMNASPSNSSLLLQLTHTQPQLYIYRGTHQHYASKRTYNCVFTSIAISTLIICNTTSFCSRQVPSQVHTLTSPVGRNLHQTTCRVRTHLTGHPLGASMQGDLHTQPPYHSGSMESYLERLHSCMHPCLTCHHRGSAPNYHSPK